MDASILLSSAFTVAAFVAFVGIVAWAYGKGPRRRFDTAANDPFALPDELERIGRSTTTPLPAHGEFVEPHRSSREAQR